MDKIIDMNIFWFLYLTLPFLFVLIFGILFFIKNTIKIRRCSKILLIIEMLFLFLNISSFNNHKFSLFGLNFLVNSQDLYLLFVSCFVFLIFIFFSKAIVKFAKKNFYLSAILLFGLLNTFILSDNVLFSFGIILWLILANFLISNLSFKSNNKKIKVKKLCIFELSSYVFGLCFIFWDFLRYFILNNIKINYSIISSYLVHIDDRAILFAFVGFLILIFRQFGFLNLIPYYCKLYNEKSFFNSSVTQFVEYLTGVSLLLKVYGSFDYLFYQYQQIIAVILTVCLLYFVVSSFKCDELLKSTNSLFAAGTIFGLFSVFCYSKLGCAVSLLYFLLFVISYIILLFAFAILEDKFGTKNINDFKKINDKTKTMQWICLFSILNFANIPIGANFFAFLSLTLSLGSMEFDSLFLKVSPYVIVFCAILTAVSLFNIFYKILIEPVEHDDNRHIVLSHQRNSIIMLVIFSFIVLFSFQNFASNVGFMSVGKF